MGCGRSSGGILARWYAWISHFVIAILSFSFEAGTVSPGPGAFAEYALLEEDISIRIPKGVSFEEAATFPLCSLTAAQVCFHRQHLPFEYKLNAKSPPGFVHSSGD